MRGVRWLRLREEGQTNPLERGKIGLDSPKKAVTGRYKFATNR